MTEQERLEQTRTVKPNAADYTGTMEALRAAENTLPDYTSSYDAEIRELYGKIINRPQFTYSPENDPVYGAYRERYVREGQYAMRDTMGQAAALTGGYGSSYAQAVGQQQYDAYLQKLGDALPQLYAQAYERYRAQGEGLQGQLDAAGKLAEAEYGRNRDKAADAKFAMELQNTRDKQDFERQQTNYKNLYDIILKTGYQPSAEELAGGGMSPEQAEALRKQYLRAHGLLPGGGGGSSDSPYAATGYPASKKDGKTESGNGKSKEEAKAGQNRPGASDTNKSRRK